MEQNNSSGAEVFPDSIHDFMRVIADGIKTTCRPTDESEGLFLENGVEKKIDHSNGGSEKLWSRSPRNLSECGLSRLKFFPKSLGKSDPKGGNRVSVSMIANGVPSLKDLLQEMRVLLRFFSNHKEGGFRLVLIKEIKNLRGVMRVWAIIDG